MLIYISTLTRLMKKAAYSLSREVQKCTGVECTANFVHSVIYEPIQIVNATGFVRKVRVVEILKRESL